MWRVDLPSVTVASRGMVALDLTVTGAAKDLHSGRHGGSAPNPVRALVGLLASMHDADGTPSLRGIPMTVRRRRTPPSFEAIRSARFDAGALFR